MNIETMVEDGLVEFWDQQAFATADFAFAAGVRHVLRSLFPVVRVEDVEIGKEYWCKPKVGGMARKEDAVWQVLRAIAYHSSDPHLSFTGNNWHRIDPPSIEEIRACPSPGDLGLGE